MFQGSIVALVTPFKDGKLDEVALRKLVDFHVKSGTAAIVPCGTTGESATLSHDEHNRVVALVVEHAAKRIKVIAGAGSNATDEAIKLTRHAKKVGADATLHITPYYNKPTQEGLYQHFATIAKSTDIPVILYNVPGRTSVNMLPETVIRLSQIDNIVGIKEASGNLIQACDILYGVDKNFALFSGEDALTYPLYCLGAKGVISVTANIVPQKMSEQYAAFQAGDFAKARAIHEELFDLHQVMFIETNPIPVKAALVILGFIEEEYRLPLVKITPAAREKLKAVMLKMKLVF